MLKSSLMSLLSIWEIIKISVDRLAIECSTRGDPCRCEAKKVDTWNELLNIETKPLVGDPRLLFTIDLSMENYSKNMRRIQICIETEIWKMSLQLSIDVFVSDIFIPPNSQLILSSSIYIVTSVTRLGDFLDFGPHFKAFGNNKFAQISHNLRQFL